MVCIKLASFLIFIEGSLLPSFSSFKVGWLVRQGNTLSHSFHCSLEILLLLYLIGYRESNTLIYTSQVGSKWDPSGITPHVMAKCCISSQNWLCCIFCSEVLFCSLVLGHAFHEGYLRHKRVGPKLGIHLQNQIEIPWSSFETDVQQLRFHDTPTLCWWCGYFLGRQIPSQWLE